MGSGASADGSAKNNLSMSMRDAEAETFSGLIESDTKLMDRLFADIAAKMEPGKINCKTKISILNLLKYFKDKPDSSLKHLLYADQVWLKYPYYI